MERGPLAGLEESAAPVLDTRSMAGVTVTGTMPKVRCPQGVIIAT